MLVLGITGGVATGKSTVTRMFADLGAPTVSADALAHDLLAPGTETTRAVLRAFPDCALPDAPETIDRRALGRRVFADPAARHQLESLTHPAIIAGLQAQVASWRQKSEVTLAAAEIPLLFEAKLQWMVDRIVVITCPRPDQAERLLVRGIAEADAYRQIAAQWPLAEKVKRADYIIETDNSTGLENTRHQVAALWAKLV